MEEVTGDVCGQDGCRERRYYLENGVWFCRQGHQQEGRQVVADDDDFGTQGRAVRREKVVAERVSKVYSGSKAYQLFLEAYQLILWKQCFSLIHDKGLPQELEVIVKELWTLRLRKLYERNDEGYLSDDTATQVFSSQTEQSTAVDDEENRYHKKQLSNSPRAVESLALCYLGILLLRIPVSIGYIQRWILRDEVPFIRLIRFIPQEMKARLPVAYHVAFDTGTVPSGDQFHRAVADLVMLYNQNFEVSFPPINSVLLLFSYIKQLSLPLEVFPAVRHLQKTTGYTFGFPPSVVGKFHRIYLPEVQLISLVIIVTKLFYPLDDVKRYPYSWDNPSVQIMDWEKWMEAQKLFDERGRSGDTLAKGEEISVNESDALHLTPQQLDDYMDWYEKMFVDKDTSNPFADMFPTSRTDDATQRNSPADEEKTILDKLHDAVSNIGITRPIPDDDGAQNIPRPGSNYRRHRSENQLDDNSKLFYEAAAKTVGVSLKTIVLAVYQTEGKINGSANRKRRRQRSGLGERAEDGNKANDIEID